MVKRAARSKNAKKLPRKPARTAAKRVAEKTAKQTAKSRSTTRRPTRANAPARPATAPKVRQGLVTHTELASADPTATRAWCARVLGWKFGEPMPTPAGPYHMWRFANGSGGGIRANNPPEVPGSIPYCEVADIKATYAQALQAGATEMFRPEPLPGGMGSIAIVSAPGGVAIGFWSPK